MCPVTDADIREVYCSEIRDPRKRRYRRAPWRGREGESEPPSAVRHVSPALAGFLTLWMPGAGHLYAGRFGEALMWFLVVGLGYVLIVPGLILHLFAIASSVVTAQRINAPPPRRLLAA